MKITDNMKRYVEVCANSKAATKEWEDYWNVILTDEERDFISNHGWVLMRDLYGVEIPPEIPDKYLESVDYD